MGACQAASHKDSIKKVNKEKEEKGQMVNPNAQEKFWDSYAENYAKMELLNF